MTGTLGRFSETDASPSSLLYIPAVILDVGAEEPAKQIFVQTTPHLTHINGSFTDLSKIREFAAVGMLEKV